ncbi:MAG TPA: DUF2934 domain-containing protein [Candidatus Acidoferrales bacterium]|nr:DUF2934 domain-containing protein [Candidatus Acidoferrales bacterium]
MKKIKTTKTKTETTPTPAAKATPAAGLDAAPLRSRAAKVTADGAADTTPMAPSLTKQTAPRREITTDLIATRAYIIWEQQGRPHGRDVANWLLAESQLKQETQSFTA